MASTKGLLTCLTLLDDLRTELDDDATHDSPPLNEESLEKFEAPLKIGKDSLFGTVPVQ